VLGAPHSQVCQTAAVRVEITLSMRWRIQPNEEGQKLRERPRLPLISRAGARTVARPPAPGWPVGRRHPHLYLQ